MGLLDSLLSGGTGGGLLDFLRSNALNQQFGSGMPSDQAQYGSPISAMAQVPQQPPSVIQAQQAPQMQAPQMQAPQQQQPMQPQGPGFGDHLMAGIQGFANSGGILPALANGISGLATGQRSDPVGVAQQAMNVTGRALLAKGVDPQTVQAAISNPELMKTLITQTYGPQTVQSLGQGYVADKNGKITRAYTPEQNDSFSIVQKGEDAMGNKTYVKLNKATGEETPLSGGGSDTPTGLGDISKSGQEYLATLPKSEAEIVKGMIDGTISPPSSFALAKKAWTNRLAAAKTVDPSFDANNWYTRHKLSTDMASSGNSSMGGILANGKSAFAHLSDLSGSMADLGNASHDYPGGGTVAAVQNYLGNKALAGSDTLAKIKAINDNLGHYGQESTKFYSGTGGGVEERMNALKEMNPTTTSSEEMASYLAKEKSLMTDRLKQKEAQIRDTMGDGYLAKHPVFTPDLQQTLDTIDGNIAKLNGSKPAAQPSSGEGAIAHNPKTGETIIRKNGKWVPYS
jgi:hypothetical protein